MDRCRRALCQTDLAEPLSDRVGCRDGRPAGPRRACGRGQGPGRTGADRLYHPLGYPDAARHRCGLLLIGLLPILLRRDGGHPGVEARNPAGAEYGAAPVFPGQDRHSGRCPDDTALCPAGRSVVWGGFPRAHPSQAPRYPLAGKGTGKAVFPGLCPKIRLSAEPVRNGPVVQRRSGQYVVS